MFELQGICPGNRLRLLVGQYDTGGSLGGSRVDLTISDDGIQRHGKRRSWHVQPNRVSAPIIPTLSRSLLLFTSLFRSDLITFPTKHDPKQPPKALSEVSSTIQKLKKCQSTIQSRTKLIKF